MSRFMVFLGALAVLYGKANAGGPATITSPDMVNITEDSMIGTTVMAVTTQNLANVVIMIESQMPMSTPPKFNVTGMNILLHDMLDFEMTSSYMLMLKAMDSTDNTSMAMQNLTVYVDDVNEAPMFNMTMYNATVTNETAADEDVITVTANDPEMDTVTYMISAASNTNMDFKIDNMGKIKTNKMINGNPMMYTLVVMAMDDKTPSLTGTTTVYVKVEEGNSAVTVVSGMFTFFIATLYFLLF